MITRASWTLLLGAILLAAAATSSPTKQSSLDQYEAEIPEDQGSKHLIRVPLTKTGMNQFSTLPLLEQNIEKINSDKPENQHRHRRENDDNNKRDRRQTIQWYSAYTPGINPGVGGVPSFTTYQQYQVSSYVPLYIPVFGTPQQIPVFFPAKPILYNPGYPIDNPPKRPEDNNVIPGENSNVPTLGTRLGEDDDRPSWGIIEYPEASRPNQSPLRTTARPSGSSSNSGRTPPPPLFHRPSSNSNSNNQASRERESFDRPQQSATSRPLGFAPLNQPQETPSQQQGQPDRCVWAIVSCCRPSSQDIRYNCFEQLGCTGAFWDRNPCSKEVTKAAIRAVEQFYDQSN